MSASKVTSSKSKVVAAKGEHIWEIECFEALIETAKARELTHDASIEGGRNCEYVAKTHFKVGKLDFAAAVILKAKAEDDYALDLLLFNKNVKTYLVNFAFSNVGPAGKKMKKISLVKKLTFNGRWIIRQFFPNTLKGSVKISIEVTAYEEIAAAKPNAFIENLDLESTLPRAFGKHLLTGEGTDFAVVCQGHEISCFKAVLMVRSEVFLAMLTRHNTRERETGQIEWNDGTKVNVARAFIRFLHTDEFEIGFEDIAEDLLMLADKYDVPALKAHAQKALIQGLRIDGESSLKMLRKALERGWNPVVEAYLSQMKAGLESDLVKSEAFKELIKAFPEVAVNMLSYD